MYQRVLTVGFITLISIGMLLLLVSPKEVYSEDENRYLAQLPTISLQSIKDGTFMDEMEEFVTDQFPHRLGWIELKTIVDLSLGKVDSNGDYMTDSGYYIEKFTDLDEEQLNKNYEAVVQFAQRMKKIKDLQVQLMLVPTASTILENKLPSYHYDLNQLELIKQLKNPAVQMVEVGEALLKHKEEEIFYKNDHHWTSLGAYYAYQSWKPNTLPLESYKHEVLSEDFLGTLYSKVKVMPKVKDRMDAYYLSDNQEVEYNLSGTITTSFYERQFLTKKDKYSVFFNGNQGVTKIKGYGKEGKLLIIKDSFANTFAQFAMTDYEEVHLIDLRSFFMSIDDYIEQEEITDVLVLYNFINFTQDKQLFLLNK